MLKNRGPIQLALLRLLRVRKKGIDSVTLACRVFGTNTPTVSQLESTRRALRGLRRDGLVDVNRQRPVYLMR